MPEDSEKKTISIAQGRPRKPFFLVALLCITVFLNLALVILGVREGYIVLRSLTPHAIFVQSLFLGFELVLVFFITSFWRSNLTSYASNKSVEGIRLTDSDVYSVVAENVRQSDDIRWTRLNTFLVVNSILVLAWVAIHTGTGIPARAYIQLLLCIIGIILGLSWAVLGWRSSDFNSLFHSIAVDIECQATGIHWRPFHEANERIRKRVKNSFWLKLTSSRMLGTALPLIFALMFILLAVASILPRS